MRKIERINRSSQIIKRDKPKPADSQNKCCELKWLLLCNVVLSWGVGLPNVWSACCDGPTLPISANCRITLIRISQKWLCHRTAQYCIHLKRKKSYYVSPSYKITAKVCAKLFSVVLQPLPFLLTFFNFTAKNAKLVTCRFLSNAMQFFYIKMIVWESFFWIIDSG